MPSKSRKLKSKKLKTRKYYRKNEKYMRKRKNASNKKGGGLYNLFGKGKSRKNNSLPTNQTNVENAIKTAQAKSYANQNAAQLRLPNPNNNIPNKSPGSLPTTRSNIESLMKTAMNSQHKQITN